MRETAAFAVEFYVAAFGTTTIVAGHTMTMKLTALACLGQKQLFKKSLKPSLDFGHVKEAHEK
jgi:hypothetical protein